MNENKYGKAALRAVELFLTGKEITPENAWAQATKAIFGENTSSQKKGCPKDAFLGLCEEGLVKGIPKGKYTFSVKNKQYAINAVTVLKKEPSLAFDIKRLWLATLNGITKTHNSQMNVVTTLWNNGLIK